MELRIPTLEEVRRLYETDMKEAFPPAELKPLSAIERMWSEGNYRPYCLYDGETIVGAAFLWLGHPGWALLDYLCVTSARRNDGLGTKILQLLPEVEPGIVIFGEAEAIEHAPDPDMAKRRLGFYIRNGMRVAEYETEVFGVHYMTFYLADREIPEEELMREHRFVYQNSFTPDRFARYVQIPRDPASSGEQIPWEQ